MNKDNKELSLSDAFKELENITAEFEAGEVDLEKGIPMFRRGLELAKYLKEKLGKIENEIEEVKAKFTDLEEETESTEEKTSIPF